jgi:3-phenylpropionate/trans-cinnamate dioxygenase ferredoxin reductase subunit
MSETIAIVGAGQAAGQAAQSLRQRGFTGPIVIIGDEPFIPYQRPPLSKKFLAGEMELERLHVKPAHFYSDHDIQLLLATRVTAIQPETRRLQLSSGKTLAYDKLLLTTGSRVRKLSIPGSDLAGIHYLRNIADVQAIQQNFRPGARLVIVGAGYIGLEVAAVAVTHGIDVTVLETETRAMNRVVAPEVSAFFHKLHTDAGVKIEFGRMVKAFGGTGSVTEVICADGSTVPADLCIVGIGIIPNTELAQAAGITCDNGIVVNEFAATNLPEICAAGDCTRHPNKLLGVNLRLESVHNALEQAKTAAATLCGEQLPYSQVPWFWSDQYDVKLQIVGINSGYDELVIRGTPEDRSFAAFYLKDRQLLAVDAINSPREFMLGKKLIPAKAHFDPAKLANPSLDFKSLATEVLQASEN